MAPRTLFPLLHLSAARINSESLGPYRPPSLVLVFLLGIRSRHAGFDARYVSYRHQRGLQYSFETRLVTGPGDCGYDNCVGEFEDSRSRMGDFATRCKTLGWESSTTVWTVSQGFGGPWSRAGIDRVSLWAQS